MFLRGSSPRSPYLARLSPSLGRGGWRLWAEHGSPAHLMCQTPGGGECHLPSHSVPTWVPKSQAVSEPLLYTHAGPSI